MAASKIPKSFNAIIAPHIPTTARIPPPDPITAMFGTYSFNFKHLNLHEQFRNNK